MGNKGIRVLLFIFFSHLCVAVFALSSSSLHQDKSSDFMQNENSRGRSTYEQNSKGIDENDTSENAIEQSKKYGHTGNGGSSGARPTNPGENGGGGTSAQGGGNYIPVYAAGAANNRHPYHRGGASSNQIGVHTLVVPTMASLLQLYAVFRCG
ncbi:uncharacterized protein LOC133797750 [Humulus lupulus]|uniref:uncharacterized protein LOC133797750 n=1 Tax=Humulus lupulus TaxID=3486 RepID=UPI002B418178|nr:uncharacterized protein LOC133797750 [Humulus lupulus]